MSLLNLNTAKRQINLDTERCREILIDFDKFPPLGLLKSQLQVPSALCENLWEEQKKFNRFTFISLYIKKHG